MAHLRDSSSHLSLRIRICSESVPAAILIWGDCAGLHTCRMCIMAMASSTFWTATRRFCTSPSTAGMASILALVLWTKLALLRELATLSMWVQWTFNYPSIFTIRIIDPFQGVAPLPVTRFFFWHSASMQGPGVGSIHLGQGHPCYKELIWLGLFTGCIHTAVCQVRIPMCLMCCCDRCHG